MTTPQPITCPACEGAGYLVPGLDAHDEPVAELLCTWCEGDGEVAEDKAATLVVEFGQRLEDAAADGERFDTRTWPEWARDAWDRAVEQARLAAIPAEWARVWDSEPPF